MSVLLGGVSERTIRRIPASELPVVYPSPRKPRYRWEDVQRYIDSKMMQ